MCRIYPPNDFAIATCSRMAIKGTRPMEEPSSETISPNPSSTVVFPMVLFAVKAGNAKGGSPA